MFFIKYDAIKILFYDWFHFHLFHKGQIHMSLNIIFRYDPDATGTINGEKLLNKLGIAFHNGSAGEDQIDRLSPVPESGQFVCFAWFDSLRPINNLSVIKEQVFLGRSVLS